MQNKFLIAAAMATFLIAGSAFAADLPGPVYKGPPPAPVALPTFSWTGFYIGAGAGFNVLSTNDVIPAYPSNFTMSSTGFAIGGKVGYNYQMPSNIVVGLEAAGIATFNNSSHLTGLGGELYTVKQNFQGDVVARLGYAFDRFMPYIKGGVAFANLNDLHYSTGFGSKSATFTGWTVGAGLDYALTDNWIIGLDYAYSAYPRKRFVYAGPNTLRPNTNTVLATVSYKF